ncbi:acyltransferase family protein [Promicromonospora sp. NPDC060204]|uniref:acyltransferase family protein n=1 Tax=Promicromonospora sp. NPDC060204 TaxID=3347071 RepID=UPI0036544DBD
MTDDRRTALRADIQALRAVAVLAVVLFHLWPNRLTGGYVGVDVFFVISGFLITSHIVRDVDAGRFSVTEFWSRRILRLLPASLLVLAVTAAGVWALAPVQHWEQWFREIAASGLYAENWVLAADAVDYLAAENVPSPVQHYWSLSAEEQFYLVWPLLIALCLLVGRRLRPAVRAGSGTVTPGTVTPGTGAGHESRALDRAGRRASWRPVVAGTLVVVVVASLVTSVVWTGADQAYAYFITPTRAWEFGAGALLAFVPAHTGRWSTAAAWAGLALIGVSAVLFTGATPFPGAWAAVPVLGTVLVIWAQASDRFTSRLAELPPVQFLGDVSYAVYLWHWPLVVLVPYATGHDLRTLDKVAILAVTLLLAWGTRLWVEKPVLAHRHRFRPRVTFVTAAVVGAAVVGVALLGVHAAREHVRTELAQAEQATTAECFGAAARPPHGEPCTNPDLVGTAVPAPEAVGDDTPEPYTEGPDKCPGTNREDPEPVACERGDRGSDVRIALVGDSHAAHYSSALVEAAETRGWSLDIYIKAGCPFSDVMRVQDEVLTAACVEWVDRAQQVLVDGGYDLVVTSQLSGVDWVPPAGTTPEAFAEDGLATLWAGLADQGLPVVAVADVPKPDPTVIDCLTDPDVDLATDCRTPRAEATGPFDPQRGAVKQLGRSDVTLLDLTDVYCDTRECFPVVGGVTVYRDDNHLSDTFARTLGPYVANAIAPLLRSGD